MTDSTPAEHPDVRAKQIADELEYRVRTALALFRSGHEYEQQITNGRARVAALLAERLAPTPDDLLRMHVALARDLDPEAFEQRHMEPMRLTAGTLQWAARRYNAREGAARAIAAGWYR